MKNRLLIILLFIFFFAACKKENNGADISATITLIHALTDVPNIKVNPSGNKFSWTNASGLAYGNRGIYYAKSGKITISAINSTDSTKNLFSLAAMVNPKIYTLYLSGSSAAPDYSLVEESNYPYIKTDIMTPPSADSVVNIRFVNLSKGSPALHIKIKDASTAEVGNLSYKGISSWKAYPDRKASTDYILEVRDNPTNGTPLLTYTFRTTATNRFKNVALVLKGTFGTSEFSISEINYF